MISNPPEATDGLFVRRFLWQNFGIPAEDLTYTEMMKAIHAFTASTNHAINKRVSG